MPFLSLIVSAAVSAAPSACAAEVPLPPSAMAIVDDWDSAVASADASELLTDATIEEKMRRLIVRDQITRANLWRVDTADLESCVKRALEVVIGERLRKIDAQNTEALKKLLPADGWFRNSVHGRAITHGAWLIAQHSPDRQFRAYALEKQKERLSSGDVDSRDYALTTDRVQLDLRLPQIYGSQAICVSGELTLYPIGDPDGVDKRREEIGWAQTLAETKGDLEIGKPCEI